MSRPRSPWVCCTKCHGRGVLEVKHVDWQQIGGVWRCPKCDGSGTTHRDLKPGQTLFYPTLPPVDR
jgi:DnaJ-class molecular chaperone